MARHNSFSNAVPATHGTDSGGRDRGSRAIEVYNNTINYTFPFAGNQIRGGTALIHNNTLTGSIAGIFTLKCYRVFHSFSPWGGATGNNNWDNNDSHGSYLTGAHDGGSASSTLVVSNANWAADQWVGYEVSNITQGKNSYVLSNTGNTMTMSGDPYGAWKWNTGDQFAIHKVLVPLDQPGRGKGDLITGEVPVNSATNSATWPRQALEPIYAWGNTRNGTKLAISSTWPTLQQNRDYYNDTPMPGYQPYTYPHPLVSGSPAPPTPPSAPTNLKIVATQ